MLFFEYGIANYPVKVVMEASIAKSIATNASAGYIMECDNRDKLESLIMKILNSKKAIGIMQELIRINQIQAESARAENNMLTTEDTVTDNE